MRTRLLQAAFAAVFVAPTMGCSVLLHPTIEGLQPPDGFVVGPDGSADGITNNDVPHADVPPNMDTPMPVDTGVCATDCNDGVSCTTDRCVAGACQHMADNALCTGGQVCDVTAGCVARRCTTNTDCGDGNPCTTDTCLPTGGGPTGCANTPIDADGDGYPAAMAGGMACAGGSDCDDANAAVHPGATEVCNGVDDNCDGTIDNTAGGCAGTNDTCATAQAVTFTATGVMTIHGTTVGANSELTSSCGQMGGPDVWYAVTLPANMVLEASSVPAADPGDTVLVARSGCTAPDIICDDDVSHTAGPAGRGSRLWLRPERGASGTRTVYIIVDSYMPGAESAFDLTLRVSDDPAPGTCGAVVLDVGTGGAVFGRIPNRAATQGTCTPLSVTHGNDDLYTFSGASNGGVTVRVNGLTGSAGGWTPSTYVRTDCTTMTSELGCATNNPAQINFNHTPGSTDYLFVDNGSTGNLYQMTVVAP